MAHMPLRGLCRRLGGAVEGSLYPLVCPEAPATCGFGASPNHIPGGGLFGTYHSELGLFLWKIL